MLYCITPLAWVEIQCFALTAYMPTCLHVDKRACLHAYTLACVHAYMHLRTCLHAYMPLLDYICLYFYMLLAKPNMQSNMRSIGAMLGPCCGHVGAMLGPCWSHAGRMVGCMFELFWRSQTCNQTCALSRPC